MQLGTEWTHYMRLWTKHFNPKYPVSSIYCEIFFELYKRTTLQPGIIDLSAYPYCNDLEQQIHHEIQSIDPNNLISMQTLVATYLKTVCTYSEKCKNKLQTSLKKLRKPHILFKKLVNRWIEEYPPYILSILFFIFKFGITVDDFLRDEQNYKIWIAIKNNNNQILQARVPGWDTPHPVFNHLLLLSDITDTKKFKPYFPYQHPRILQSSGLCYVQLRHLLS